MYINIAINAIVVGVTLAVAGVIADSLDGEPLVILGIGVGGALVSAIGDIADLHDDYHRR